jgi:hypothetical protein
VGAEAVGGENLGSPVGDWIGMCSDEDGDGSGMWVASLCPSVHGRALLGARGLVEMGRGVQRLVCAIAHSHGRDIGIGDGCAGMAMTPSRVVGCG